MAKTHGVEAYLVAIYNLEGEDGVVLSSHVANYLRVSRPTVTQTIRRLVSLGLVESGAGRGIVLTENGRIRAEQVIRRHRLLECWLHDELNIGWAESHAEADRLEHAVSPLVEERLMEKLGFPTTCPHGNVIPGSGYRQPKGSLLSEHASGATVQILRICEQAEDNLELLTLFHNAGLVPGAMVQIVGREDIPGRDVEMHLIIGKETLPLMKNAAKWIVVKEKSAIS